jgi:nucleoside phosphorylase
MIARDRSESRQGHAAFVAWFDALPRVQHRQNQIARWVAGDETRAIPTLDPSDPDLPRDFIQRLRTAFGGKCVYCEQLIPDDAAARLHLYRPPFAALQQRGRIADNQACYKWLRWNARNLQLTCAECNLAKGSLFPILGQRAARGQQGDELHAEEALILSPFQSPLDPLRHLRFDHEHGRVAPALIDDLPSPLGASTIEALELNRAALVEARRQAAADLVERWASLSRSGDPERRGRLVAELPELRALCDDNAPFAGLHRQLLWRLIRSSRPSQARDWLDFRDELARWNGVTVEPQEPSDADQQRLERSRQSLAELRQQAQAEPARVSESMLRKARTARQQIVEAKRALRRRGVPVDDLPVDTIVLKRTLPHELPGVDILLVTATEVEARALRAESEARTGRAVQTLIANKKAYHDLGQIGGASTVMVQSGMGAGGADGATLTIHEGIHTLRPRAIIMLGIAFGVDPVRQQLGDILVAQQLLCYELQRWGTDQQGEPQIVLRGSRPAASPDLLNRFRAAVHDWQGARVRVGLLLSGDKLVDNQALRDQLRRQAPEALGGEMEGSGLFAAAHLNQRDWIVVKAISDWADGKKATGEAQNQERAATNAAAFVLHTLQRGGFGA